MAVEFRRRMGVMFAFSMIATVNGCGPPFDPSTALSVTDITTGWLDVGFDELQRNKLVPIVSFRIENVTDSRVRALQITGVFRRCEVIYEGQLPPEEPASPPDSVAGTCLGEDREWGSTLIRAVGREGIEPGQEIGPFTMENKLGYTGEQSRLAMLQHRDFVDVKIEIFVKHRADQWAKLGEFPIERQLLTQ